MGFKAIQNYWQFSKSSVGRAKLMPVLMGVVLSYLSRIRCRSFS